MTSLPTVVVLSLVAWRVAHLIVSDHLTAPIRERVQDCWPATPDDAVLHRRGGVTEVVPVHYRRKVHPYGPGYWVGCIACVSLWVAVTLTTAVTVAYGQPRPVLVAAAVAGGALLVDRVTS